MEKKGFVAGSGEQDEIMAMAIILAGSETL
jgi:hypothetical protein